MTTNPSLMAKEGIKGTQNQREHYIKICEIVNGDVSAEVIATDYEGMIREGEELAAHQYFFEQGDQQEKHPRAQPQFAVAVFQYIVHKDFVHFGDACEVIRLSVVTHQPRGRAYP